VYDDVTQAWYLSATQTVDPGKLSYFTVPALTNRAENSAGSISAFLLVTPPGGDATGTYTFTMGGDLGAGTVNVTATVSTAGLATSALQTSANTKLDTLHADLGTTLHTDLATTLAGKLDTLHTDILALKDPNTLTAITPSDSTDVTATCTKGLFVAVTGNVNVTGVGGTAQSLGTQVAGTRIRIALSKVNAATTATVFGLSGP
jgi:hypothetical protein